MRWRFRWANRPFPSSPGPLFQNEGRCSAFDMEIIFHSHANKTHFHKKSCAPNLIFKVRVFGTWNWPIHKSTSFGFGGLIYISAPFWNRSPEKWFKSRPNEYGPKKMRFQNSAVRICLEGAKLNVLSLSLSQENHLYFSILISQSETHTLE